MQKFIGNVDRFDQTNRAIIGRCLVGNYALILLQRIAQKTRTCPPSKHAKTTTIKPQQNLLIRPQVICTAICCIDTACTVGPLKV